MARAYSHLTPRYIVNRLRVMLDERLHPANPWLTAEAVRLLERLIFTTDEGVEFGSGRSTVWFAKRLAKLTSVEHDGPWLERVTDMIAKAGVADKVDYRHCVTDDEYVMQAATFADNSVGFCLVDGNARDRCALAMIPKMKPGGVLVIDNINCYLPHEESVSPATRRSVDGCASEIWQQVKWELSGWRHIWTSNGVTDTGIWLKP